MTVKELKEKLDEFPDDTIVEITEEMYGDKWFVELRDVHLESFKRSKDVQVLRINNY